MTNCFLCQRPFTPDRRAIPVVVWDIEVCEECRKWNWDGLVPGVQTRLMKHFKLKGIEPRLNASGWIEWPNSN